MKTRNSHGLLQLGREALAYCQCASALISGNKALLVSVDLIGEKNQVILEYLLYPIYTNIMTRSVEYLFHYLLISNIGSGCLGQYANTCICLKCYLYQM